MTMRPEMSEVVRHLLQRDEPLSQWEVHDVTQATRDFPYAAIYVTSADRYNKRRRK